MVDGLCKRAWQEMPHARRTAFLTIGARATDLRYFTQSKKAGKLPATFTLGSRNKCHFRSFGLARVRHGYTTLSSAAWRALAGLSCDASVEELVPFGRAVAENEPKHVRRILRYRGVLLTDGERGDADLQA